MVAEKSTNIIHCGIIKYWILIIAMVLYLKGFPSRRTKIVIENDPFIDDLPTNHDHEFPCLPSGHQT